MSLRRRSSSVLALAAFVAVGVTLPEFTSISRKLSFSTEKRSATTHSPQTQTKLPAGFEFTCPVGEELVVVDWTEAAIDPKSTTQTVRLNNSMDVTLTLSKTGNARIEQFDKLHSGIMLSASVDEPTAEYIIPTVGNSLKYPQSYITLAISFNEELKDLLISVGDIDSIGRASDAVRIRMEDAEGVPIPMTIATTSPYVKHQLNWAYNTMPGMEVDNPGYDLSLYAKAEGKVKTIYLDQSALIFQNQYLTLPGNTGMRGVFPALDFRFCAVPISKSSNETQSSITTQSSIETQSPTNTQSSIEMPTCMTSVEKYTDTFTLNTDGWTNHDGTPAKLQEYSATGQFLGRYATGNSPPTKVYSVGTAADYVKLQFDFLEMDSWDNSVKFGCDTLFVHVNEERIAVENLNGNTFNNGERKGMSQNGIEWSASSSSPPADLGGNPTRKDQLRVITALIPKQFYPDGQLELKFEVFASKNVDFECAGFDNISVTLLKRCEGLGDVGGDTLIMGLAGQLFEFEGRSGAWYSAISTDSFQWNMKFQEYRGCPNDSNKFVSGVGFTLFNKIGSRYVPAHRIAINAVNDDRVPTDCRISSRPCLGNGSLELVIDGQKYLDAGDYQLKGGSGQVIAFNTPYQCARKWYNFDSTPTGEESGSLGASRRQHTFPGVFNIVQDPENTVESCSDWTTERQENNDLFNQPGQWSTLIIKMDSISLHVEYKQERKRCNSHNIDVWISAISPDLYDEDWGGILGETKDPSNHGEEKVDRSRFLRFKNDESYEVTSPFAVRCEGCRYFFRR